MIKFVCCAIALFFVTVLIISLKIDRSRYRNCYFLFFALVSTIIAIVSLAGAYKKDIIVCLFLLIMAALLIVPFFLIVNGILMIKREGRSLANLLSFFLGIIIGIGELTTVFGFIMPVMSAGTQPPDALPLNISRLSLVVSGTIIYFSMSFLIFMLYCVFLQLIPRKRDFDYVIIHGAGLLDGNKVSKLLADRLDKAIELYQKDPTPPIMIPSGGKGNDERISEAEAMAQYLIDKGIPANMIIKEDQSATTFENLKNSKAIIDAREGSKYTVLVTSNYHVYRALRYCRKIGLKCTGVGSHVAFYYWPSALIREFVAVHREKKHLITLLTGWLVFLLPVLMGFFIN